MNPPVYVWDKFVRLFHWSLVALFAFSYATGESESIVHIYSGYLITALVLSRILWGFIGSRHARFRDFIFSPATIISYSKSLLQGNPAHYSGHNPLGGLMVVALLATLLLTTFSGMKLYAVEEGKGPLATAPAALLVPTAQADSDDHDRRKKHADDEDEELWEEIHEASVNLMLLLILLHVAGVIFSSRLHRESLVKAMLSGYKQPPR
ncbi:cytochrome b/b6 domain-containing protein [Pseudomaricurvus sp. HS19]|uniref:cytochrome b/b6 domain-containing protein n=1 Tax=Pseudomaricurvus sp. HS19 TaxID=2692626 RepID=UPI00136CA369|nr:cytochrome b/b6 domain-containing protein [Pseudomaricurvus sp. HS19]MYM63682.1 cytochrome B [Pseudomaricurvus sp. HS19]